MIKKFGYFFGICAYALGAIGGFGYAIYCKAYLTESQRLTDESACSLAV